MGTGRGALLALALAVLTVHATPAFAQNDAAIKRAEKLFLRGERYYSLGKFEEALKSYQAAYDLVGQLDDSAELEPDFFLFNIAQCYRNLGDYEQAVDRYREYLRKLPNASNKAAVQKTIETLEKELARRKPRNDELVNGNGNGNGSIDTGGRPFYKRWQFWTGVAVVAVAGAATTYYFLRDDRPGSDLGNVDIGK